MDLMTYAALYPGRPGYGAATLILPERRKLVERRRQQWERQGATVVIVTADEASKGLRVWDAAAEKERSKP